MHPSVYTFAEDQLPEVVSENFIKDVLEVGSLNVNGSLRDYVRSLGDEPYFGIESYVGIDIQDGDGVDIVMPAEDLPKRFSEQFDLIICTEMLEHAENWREAINGMKHVLNHGGYIFITTRSPGFPYHEYPGDHWRYTKEDMYKIFRDFDVIVCIDDHYPDHPGVFLVAEKPLDWREPCDLSGIELAKP